MRRSSRVRLAATACVVTGMVGAPLVVTARAQSFSQSSSRDTSITLPATAVVDITHRTGHVIVRGIDGTTGSVRGGGSRYQLRTTGVGLTVNAREDGRRRSDDGPLELDVPRGVRLLVNTATGDVTLRDLTGDVEVHTATGDVSVQNITGRVIVESLSGDVDVMGTPTAVRVTTASGDVTVRGLRGELEAHSTSGTVRVDGPRITRALVENFSGDVVLEGSLDPNARLQLRTHNGDIVVHVPTDAKGQLELSTINGELTGAGPITLLPGDIPSRGGRSTRRYEFNGGGPLQLDISTFNGDVRIVRGIRS